MQSLGTLRLRSTLSNIACPIIYRNSLGFKHCNSMHAYKPESQRVPQEYRQLSLSRLELKRSHDRQKLAGGLRGGIDATGHALKVIDVHTVYSAQPIYTLSRAIASSSKVKKLRIGK